MSSKVTIIRALRSKQAGVAIYSFFLPGSKVLEIADICRLSRSNEGLDGFQRDGIKKHISSMVDYLNSGDVLFPNAILLALSPKATFTRSRGPAPDGLIEAGEAGTLRLPTASNGVKCAWIVDGQQRSMALAQANDLNKPVPIIAFVSDNIQMHREQFILVNKARPLPKRLVDELLPEVDATRLPLDMVVRQIPSALVSRLDNDPESPFYGIIRRTTSMRSPERVVTDSALTKSIQSQIQQPLGSLAHCRSVDSQSSDPNAMYDLLIIFWQCTKEAFPDAWGLPPEQSRLMHSAGITAMSGLMDFLLMRAGHQTDLKGYISNALGHIAPMCAWVDGVWPNMNCAWNDVESTSKDIRRLTDELTRLTQPQLLRQAIT